LGQSHIVISLETAALSLSVDLLLFYHAKRNNNSLSWFAMDAAVRLDLPEEMELSELLYSLTTGHVSALS